MATADVTPAPMEIEEAEVALKKIRALMGLISTSSEVLTDDDMRWTAVVIHDLAHEGLKALGKGGSEE